MYGSVLTDFGRSSQKYISSVAAPDAPRKSRTRRIDHDSEPLTPCPPRPTLRIVGDGGFGTLDTLPREVRQITYGYVFDIATPITVQKCCGANTTRRERNACRKHDSSKFDILRVSKAFKLEASWVFYSQGSLHIEVDQSIAQYLVGDTRSLRQLGKSTDKEMKAIWAVAPRFRHVHVSIPEETLRLRDPILYSRQLVEVVCLLSKARETSGDQLMAASTVTIDLGTIFHQMLPFNTESQAEDKYEQLLDWMYANSYTATELDFEQMFVECEQNLRKLAVAMGMHRGSSNWAVVTASDIGEEDEGGANALVDFQMTCARNRVAFEHRY
jgi:hypothetical protein